MLSRSVRAWEGVSNHEGIIRAVHRWTNPVPHGALLPIRAHSTASGGEMDRRSLAPHSATPEVSSDETTRKWERFWPRQILSRITNYFRSSTSSSTAREEVARDSFVVFMKAEESHHKMGAEELGALLRSMGQNVTDEELQEILRVANSVEGGSSTVLDFPTFMKNMVGKMEGSELERDLIEIFKGIDKDEDGFISASELRQAISDLGVRLSDAEFEEVVRDAGVGADARFNFEDFVKAMMAQSEFWQ